MRHRQSTPRAAKPAKQPSKILDLPVPAGLHDKMRKSLAKITHPDVSKADTAAEMVKINNKLERIRSIQEKTTHIQFVVDTSGSMSGHRKELANSYNKLLERQSRYASKSTFGYKSFHEEIEPKPLSAPNYLNEIRCSGGTPLFDTIGNTIEMIDSRLDSPTDVVVVILTDGYDTGPDWHSGSNAKHFSITELAQIIQGKITLGWQFIYCTQERSISDAEKIGIPQECATVFGQFNKMLGQINQMLTSYRQGDTKLLTFGGSGVIQSS